MQDEVSGNAQQAETSDLAQDKFLIYTLSGETYGTPLLQIKEVIKLAAIKPVPHTAAHYKGVINLRGQIVGVVDLRVKFGLPILIDQPGLILVIESAIGLIGAIVDDIKSVYTISPNQIEANPGVESKLESGHLLGIAKASSALINLINLSKILSSRELKESSTQKEAA